MISRRQIIEGQQEQLLSAQLNNALSYSQESKQHRANQFRSQHGPEINKDPASKKANSSRLIQSRVPASGSSSVVESNYRQQIFGAPRGRRFGSRPEDYQDDEEAEEFDRYNNINNCDFDAVDYDEEEFSDSQQQQFESRATETRAGGRMARELDNNASDDQVRGENNRRAMAQVRPIPAAKYQKQQQQQQRQQHYNQFGRQNQAGASDKLNMIERIREDEFAPEEDYRNFDPYSVYGEEDEEEDVWYSEERLFEVSETFGGAGAHYDRVTKSQLVASLKRRRESSGNNNDNHELAVSQIPIDLFQLLANFTTTLVRRSSQSSQCCPIGQNELVHWTKRRPNLTSANNPSAPTPSASCRSARTTS